MPLAVRYVQPKRLCRGPLPSGVKNELHAVAVLSLAGTIHQISSLAKHAESLLGELCDTLGKYNERTLSLQNRVTHLRKKVIPKLDIQAEADNNAEVVLVEDHFQSDHHISQQLLCVKTAPEALLEQYESSEKIPPLYHFTPHFEDGRNAMHIYSNPEFFFNSWRTNMERDAMKRRSGGNLDSVIEESTEVVQKQPTNNRKKGSKNDISYSSTLPIRVKARKRSSPPVPHIFSSVRGRNNRKQRPVINDDMYTSSQNHSESSGYMSQHSSYNSLLDQESFSSLNSQDRIRNYKSTSSLPSTANDPKNVSSSIPKVSNGDLTQPPNKPKVLNRTRSSSSDRSGWSHRGMVAKENGILSLQTNGSVSPNVFDDDVIDNREDTPPISKYSPHKESLPTSLNGLEGSPIATRKESFPTKLSPPIISPTASPEIRRRVEMLTQVISQSSHDLEIDVFSFPDPLEVLKTHRLSTELTLLNGISDLSPDDFPPIDQNTYLYGQPDSQKCQTSSKNQPTPPHHRRAPSPPKGGLSRRHSMSLSNSSQESPRPRLKSQGSSNGSLSRRTSDQSLKMSPSIPKRKAPPPPSPGKEKRASRHLSLEGTPTSITIDKFKYPPGPTVQDKGSEIIKNNPSSPIRGSVELHKELSQELERRSSKFLQQEEHIYHKIPERRMSQEKEKSKRVPQEKEHIYHKISERQVSHEKVVKKAGLQEKDAVHSKPNPVQDKKSSHDKEKKKVKNANQILKSSGVNTIITAERSNLLAAIRHGIQLNKVKSEEDKRHEDSPMPWDVAAILERRQALANSDNEFEETAVQEAEWEDV